MMCKIILIFKYDVKNNFVQHQFIYYSFIVTYLRVVPWYRFFTCPGGCVFSSNQANKTNVCRKLIVKLNYSGRSLLVTIKNL